MATVLGITGGIATGKSTVVDVFRKAGIPIVDGDVIARQVVAPESQGLRALVAAFGTAILQENGSLNRKQLGELIFKEPHQRQLLDHTLAPFLRREITKQIDQAKEQAALVIADIPLLFESGYEETVDQIAVVYVPEAVQLSRLMKRDQLTKEQAQQRIDSQLPIEEKKLRADIIFDNQKSIRETQAEVQDWLKLNFA